MYTKNKNAIWQKLDRTKSAKNWYSFILVADHVELSLLEGMVTAKNRKSLTNQNTTRETKVSHAKSERDHSRLLALPERQQKSIEPANRENYADSKRETKRETECMHKYRTHIEWTLLPKDQAIEFGERLTSKRDSIRARKRSSISGSRGIRATHYWVYSYMYIYTRVEST